MLSTLDDEQKRVIAAKGDVLVTACPGSGKTHTLIHRLAVELAEVTSHREVVVAITYTHAAADEIRDRIEEMGVDTSQLWVGTIHSFCLNWILRPYAPYHDHLKHGFSVVDIYESERLLEEIVGRYESLRSGSDCRFYASENGLLPDSNAKEDVQKAVQLVVEEYTRRLLVERKIDFEMMLQFAYDLIRKHAPIAKRLSRIFRLIAIDEYQDTRSIQYSIVSRILLERSSFPRLFVVGDPNQAIYGSLGGVAKTAEELSKMCARRIDQLVLSGNYRSSQQIVDYFSKFAVHPIDIRSTGANRAYQGDLVFDKKVGKDVLVSGIASIVRRNVEEFGVRAQDICIVGPWWVHLAALTRALVRELPEYTFNGPGLSPFGQNLDNFWYKVARIALTDSAPDMFRRRVRWANEVLLELDRAGHRLELGPRDLLRVARSVQVSETDSVEYLKVFFDHFLAGLGLVIESESELAIQREGFFGRMGDRIKRIKSSNADYLADVDSVKVLFRPRSGVVISTIHGVKGMEFDSVIAFGLLDGMVPHFSVSNLEREDAGKKLLYVIGSRARKNLYLISERGRGLRYNREAKVLGPLREYPYTGYSILQFE